VNINNPTTFSAPDLTYTTSNSSGTAGALRADDSIAIFSAAVPETIAYGQSAAAGDDAFASRLDHVHGMAASDAVSVASQVQMEAASVNTVFASPGQTQYHPGIVKAWVQSTATGVLTGSYNVGSVDDNGTGDWTVNFTTVFSAATYAVSGLPLNGGADILLRVADASNADKTYIHAVVGGTKTDTAWFAMFTGPQ